MNLLQSIGRHTSGVIGRETRLITELRPFYESLLSWSNRGRGIPWTINGASYRVDPSQRHRLGQNYDAAVAEFLRERVQPGALCLDVGANVGVYVLQFAHWSSPNGKIIAFEPNPTAYAILEKHVQMNRLTDRVVTVPLAVGEATGEAVLYAAGAEGMSRLGGPNALLANVNEVQVSVVTLDEYCKADGLQPDWLFMDIEGFEIGALAGARNLIESRRGQMGIVVEMHPDLWPSANASRERAKQLLVDLNLCALPLTGQTDPLGQHGLVNLSYV